MHRYKYVPVQNDNAGRNLSGMFTSEKSFRDKKPVQRFLVMKK